MLFSSSVFAGDEELVSKSVACKNKNVESFHFTDATLFLCNEDIKKIEYKDVVSFFYNKECPKGYGSIDKLDLFIGDDFMSACKSTSLDLLKKNISNSDRIHFYKKSKCPKKFIFIAGTDKIQFCLIK